jgi:hypothetical protein
MAKRGGSLEQGLACATAFGFGQFRAQIKAGGRGVLTKRFAGQRRSPEDGMRRQGLSCCPRQ